MDRKSPAVQLAARLAVSLGFIGSVLALAGGVNAGAADDLKGIESRYKVTRLNGGKPIVTEAMFTALGATPREGENMNGPSVIRVPDWIPADRRADPRAKYYLYFAHHVGEYIRLAWAEAIEGPWTLYRVGTRVEPGSRGVLDLGSGKSLVIAPDIELRGHVASPDIHIDDDARRIVMYFHAPALYRDQELSQRTCVAGSADGLGFVNGVAPVALGNSYSRVFAHDGKLFSIGFGGALFQATSGRVPWTAPASYDFQQNLWRRVGTPFADALQDAGVKDHRVRHVGILPKGRRLEIFFTLIGGTPERILLADMDLDAGEPQSWRPKFPPQEVLRAELEWEGGDLPPATSRQGQAPENINQMRDPRPFLDVDGTLYLFYTARGENALGVARLEIAR